MPVFKKERNYGKQIDINALTQAVSSHLQQQRWKVQQRVEGNRGVIQAQRGGILSDIVAAERALTMTFEQTPGGTRMTVGVGKLAQNLGVMALETLFLSPLFVPIDLSEIIWTDHVEKGIMVEVDNIVNSM